MIRGIPQIDKDKCKGCGLCILVCPKSVLKLSKEYNKNGVNYSECVEADACIACNNCALMCPDSAIEIFKEV